VPGSWGRVFVVTGPSGVGKGSLIAAVRERIPELQVSISATTRAPRTGEMDGVHYHFLDAGEFERSVQDNAFLEHADYSGNRYGTLRSEIETKAGRGIPVILEIEVQGARQIRTAMPEAVQIFIAPPRVEVLRERLEGRGTDGPEAIDARMKVAVDELRARPEFEHEVVNGDFEGAVEALEAIIRAELSQSV
jgi:guanylate kinase